MRTIKFETKREIALTAFAAAVAMALVLPVYRRSLLILISAVGVLLIFLVDKVHKDRVGE